MISKIISMKCIEKIYRKEGCARNGHFGVPKSIYRAQKKKNNGRLVKFFSSKSSWKPKTHPNDTLFFFWGTIYWFGHTIWPVRAHPSFRYIFSIHFIDIIFRYIFSISFFDTSNVLRSQKNRSEAFEIFEKLRKGYNIDISKDNKNFEERKKLQGLQMDLS